jgi:hypothetical protein
MGLLLFNKFGTCSGGLHLIAMNFIITWSNKAFNRPNTNVLHGSKLIFINQNMQEMYTYKTLLYVWCRQISYAQNYWVFGLFPSSGILEITTFRKLYLFRPQVKVKVKTPTQLGPLKRVNLNHWFNISFKELLSRISGSKRDVVMGDWRKLHNVELHNLYSSPNIIRMI